MIKNTIDRLNRCRIYNECMGYSIHNKLGIEIEMMRDGLRFKKGKKEKILNDEFLTFPVEDIFRLINSTLK